ncbi:toll/interleukin-1 receptor domain-containing protein [Brucella pseudogrignonensis]|uniref:toll/interleukin-1 receptor domain-containing protein n=1 Tax=Brucella pseudogrignonensis TaxID=419475 RepID=UPI001E58EEC6|nr:toll/interleukin-1 receptor domain-containing protein [Brucella pseudogrignonensis]MCD4512195.1 toll/interleukin-1 receptor domain-containing protein [Brucella pseudogrignonensis]
MKIFISWSGERSEALAKALKEWFPLVLHFVEPWLSQSDIQAGERWGIEVAKGLESCNFGIICVTRENLVSPWILFESGALAKSMEDGRVIPLLLDLDFKEISGPLSQFQAKKADPVGIKELASSLNKVSANPVPEAQFEKLFAALWGDLEKNIAAIPKSASAGKHTRPQGEILEELVASVRTVEMRMRDVVDEEPFIRRRKRYRFHPGMLNELMHRVSEGPRDPIQILIIASLLREDFPWIYELAVDAHRSLKSNPTREGQKALRRFLEAMDMIQNGPFLDEFGGDRMMMKMIRSDLFEMLHSLRFELEQPRKPGGGRVVKKAAEQKKDS